MKQLFLILGLLFSTITLSQEKSYKQCDITGEIIYNLVSSNGVILEEGRFNINGKHTGTWKQYSPNGELLVIAKFKEGKKHGTWKHYANNTYAEVVYVNGRRVKARQIVERTYTLTSN